MYEYLRGTATFSIEIAFSDGSVLKFQITGINGSAKVTFTLVKMTDSDGNEIPLSRSEVDGIYHFSSESNNFQGFLGVVEMHGVNTVGWESYFHNASGGSIIITEGQLVNLK